MRTLTANATTQKNSTSATPIVLVRIDWGGSLGTKWYGDRNFGSGNGSSWDNAEGRVLSFGRYSASLNEQQMNAADDLRLTLRDEDKTVWTQWATTVAQACRVRLYHTFGGLVWADAVLVFDGVITGQPEWKRDDATSSFDVVDRSLATDRPRISV